VVANDQEVETICAKLRETDLLIAVHESTGHHFFDAVNSLCLRSRCRWMRVAIDGTTAALGPTVIPFQTACFTCYDLRSASNESDTAEFRSYRKRVNDLEPGPGESYPPLLDTVTGQTVLEIVRLLTGYSQPSTIGAVCEFSADFPNVKLHPLLRVPRCPSCCRRPSFRDPWDRDI